MPRVLVVGIGPGGPDQLTVEAVRALNEVDVFVVADKGRGGGGSAGADDLVRLREEVCRRHVSGAYRMVEVPDPERDRSPVSYGAAVRAWHQARAERYEQVLLEQVADGEVVGFLVWGDPALYDSTLRVLDQVRARGRVGVSTEVVPGVSSIALLAARHRIVLNRVGAPVVVTTGRLLPEAVAAGHTDLVVMLDGALTCAELTDDWQIWWGANLGTAGEELVSGRLADVLPAIRAARGRARRARGWVMDTYLLRRERG